MSFCFVFCQVKLIRTAQIRWAGTIKWRTCEEVGTHNIVLPGEKYYGFTLVCIIILMLQHQVYLNMEKSLDIYLESEVYTIIILL